MKTYKSPSELLTIIKNISIGVLIILIGGGIGGGIVIYGTVQRLDERTAYLPSVNALIVTQNHLNGKVDQCAFDSFMIVFCRFIKEQSIQLKKQDSINLVFSKMMKERGVRDSIVYVEKKWIKEGKEICNHCPERYKR